MNLKTSIVTKTGDQGTTGLASGLRIAKNELRIHAIGEVDELNAQLGMLLCRCEDPALTSLFVSIQRDLFELGAELAAPEQIRIQETLVTKLELAIQQYDEHLPPLTAFILPGGCLNAAQAHLCRTVCRRVERAIVAVHYDEGLNAYTLQYINRLSDLLFIIARFFNHLEQHPEPQW